ncbi:MAG: hypothetical protein JRM76_00790 [Nitrososphaerota archaeon]|nr:hypothetical protein [Nitrososphaerota archaeon]MDG6903313.1 hypothetical protein [Nitrososphaerota archaeon]MDG6911825.1 hypothetical protein [Nitrososphaerota archaeon]MDG6961004.1 hypothetical protein [Nitrososphaerota archaeon]MDG6963122.1 hypothetical protein [Nitrososphaerota archaeon]
MDYFAAVQEGKRRVNRALTALQKVAGPSYPMLILKLGAPGWTPVGEEMMNKVVPGKNSTAALVICDAGGNSKAMSAWLPAEEAEEASRRLDAEGIPVFPGEVKLPI